MLVAKFPDTRIRLEVPALAGGTVTEPKGGTIMGKRNIHTVPRDNGWANIRDGSDRASSLHPTKRQAVDAGRDAARRDHVEHLIHKKDGTIGERNSYGGDPNPPKG